MTYWLLKLYQALSPAHRQRHRLTAVADVRIVVFIAIVQGVLVNAPLSAQPAASPAKIVTAKSISNPLTGDQANEALQFAAEHHPELAGLLQRLRKTSRPDFERGIREIHSAQQRLERYRLKQPSKFDSELLRWKTDSQVRLLTAKWAMSKDPKLEARIQDLLRARQQEKLDRLKSERNRLAERLETLDQQIGMGQAELEADLASEWDRLSKRAAASVRHGKRPTKRPAGTKAMQNDKKTSRVGENAIDAESPKSETRRRPSE